MQVNSDKLTEALSKKISGFSIDHTSYIPDHIKRIIKRIESEKFEEYVLFGFGSDMKWLVRCLLERGIRNFRLADWREAFIGFDCGGFIVEPITPHSKKNSLVIACSSSISEILESMSFLIKNNINDIPVIYEHPEPHDPLRQQEPFKSIGERAANRAKSMISDSQLFDLIQFVKNCKNVPGSILEYGSLHGGSGAFLAEASNYFSPSKEIYLFDTFNGIPHSSLGLDYRWNGAFSNNSYSEVKSAFKDLKKVKIIQGNIMETYSEGLVGPVSLCYIASDTLETCKLLLENVWPVLNQNGIIAVCDYGSYPNCLPLTAFVNLFFEDKNDSLIFQTSNMGIFIVKR